MSCSALETMKASLARLESEKDAAVKEACRIESAIELVEWDIAKEVWGIFVGCLVRCGKDVYSVSGDRIKYMRRLSEKPWLHGRRKKKDGTFEASARLIYRDWELITDE